jgi:hypothetical protein
MFAVVDISVAGEHLRELEVAGSAQEVGDYPLPASRFSAEGRLMARRVAPVHAPVL